MKGLGYVSAVSVALTATTALAATKPVTIRGNAFFAGEERFYIRGVAYQPGQPTEYGPFG
jgi:hypothetical protein